jgi:hypothetical protein
LKDGSRKRRRGLNLESGGAEYTLPNTLAANDLVNHVKWGEAGGDPTQKFIVVKMGTHLVFFKDDINPSSVVQSQNVDLTLFKVSGKSDSDISQNPVSMEVARGKLFVVGRYLEPIFITWDKTKFTTTKININERDFVGLDDGVSNRTKPTTLSASHEYNLKVRGWLDGDIDQYNTDQSEYPSKNQIPWMGYRRQTATGFADEDGIRTWNSDKLAGEVFGDASAPTGRPIINPFDTEFVGEPAGAIPIESWTTTWTGGTTVTITSTSHGLSNGNEIVINGNSFTYYYLSPPEDVAGGSLDGNYTIANVTANTFDITVPVPEGFDSFVDQNLSLGNVSVGSFFIKNPTPFTTNERPQVVVWFAGRLWYMGIDDEKLNDRVYFTQIVESDEQFGKAYQQADPTSPNINALTASDGGVIVVPKLGRVKSGKVFNDSLLIFASNGIWQIGGGQRGFFTADGYSVRKIGSLGASSPFGIVSAGGNIYWTGTWGLQRLFESPETGFLTVESVTRGKIQTLWNNIKESEQEKIKLAYDKTQNRIYILYQSGTSFNASEYDVVLVYNTTFQSFHKLKFPRTGTSYITHIFSVFSSEEGENDKNIKFVVQTNTGTKVKICDMAQSDYVDFDGNEQIPFIETGYDNFGGEESQFKDIVRTRQAPIVHVFMKKTETGYTQSGTDLIPVNESSLTLQSRWDWADHTNSGKFGTAREVYRHGRLYTPVDINDTFDTGFPVVVTRNKIRGSGRMLHLRFQGGAQKDAHLLGWSVRYKINRRI